MIITQPKDFPISHTQSTGLVPTMGALHEGHLSLIRRAKQENDRVVVSIFVNPTQFGPNEDFAKYPRMLDRDIERASSAGADLFFTPSIESIYSSQPSIIKVPGVTEFFEGELRPGHFEGVATIVSKLFHIVAPNRAYFGMKDLQQCAVIRKMVNDFNEPVELIFCETTREPDGLAMSSRNAYLSVVEREKASNIYAEMQIATKKLKEQGYSNEIFLEAKASLTNLGFQVQYFDLVEWNTMKPSTTVSTESFIVVAAKLGSTRLIDNLKVLG